MRTAVPRLLPLFRSEMQVRLLALLLLQPERSWTLSALAEALEAPASSVHRELDRAEAAGILVRDSSARPHRFSAATSDAFYEPLRQLLAGSVGVEEELRRVLDRGDVEAAVLHGSWVTGERQPGSDIDLLVVAEGETDLRMLRQLVRPVGEAAGRTIDVVLLSPAELRRMTSERASFARHVLEEPTVPLIGDLHEVLAA